MRSIVCSAWLLTAVCLKAAAPHMPLLETQSLSEKKLSIPADLPAGETLLIIGFTKGSQPNSEAWGKQLRKELGKDFRYYSIAVLEDVPRLIRGMVAGNIRRTTPKDEHDRFLIVYKNQNELKRAVGFEAKAPDDAYLVLVDKSGAMSWIYHGPPSTYALNQVKTGIESGPLR